MELTRIKSKIKGLLNPNNGQFSGPYLTWEQAVQKASGYDDPRILEQVKNAALAVKNDPSLFARDGLIFSTPQYTYPLLAALLKIAVEREGKLSVLDFGGGLGSTYYAFKNYCPAVKLQWSVIEQPTFVTWGNDFLQDGMLSFYENISSLLQSIDVIILSGTLQYLEHPYVLLNELIALNAPYFLLDRTWCDETAKKDQILVEHVPEHIYKSSYPCWLFNYNNLKAMFANHYQMLFEFYGLEGSFWNNGFKISSKGFFCRRNK